MGRRDKKEKKEKNKKKSRKILKILFRIFLVFVVLGIIAVGVLIGLLVSLMHGQWALSDEILTINYANSTVVDKDGNILATLSGDENRIIISKNEMSSYLYQAFVSIEDERFEQHKGVDIKRTLGAVLNFTANGGTSSYGGSTITQQCIKNLTDERADTGLEGVLRKVKEMCRAYQLEQIWSKDQIMELYLNLIPLGGGGKNIHGVEMAARYYFNKNAKDLTLIESAYLAGITHAPNAYNPFGDYPYGTDENKTNKVNKRVTDVLYKMHQLGKLGDEEYQAALQEVENGIKFEQGSTTSNTNHSYHTEAAINQIVTEMMEQFNITEGEAKLKLYGGGYTIYTTQDTAIQNLVQDAYVNNKDWITTTNVTKKDADGNSVKVTEQMQSAMVIIDHSTGYVVAGAGALGEKPAWGINRMTATQHQPGSSIKPIAVIGPSLQEGLITAATVVDDTKVSYNNWTPKNDDGYVYRGLMNIRSILRVSRNVPEVKMMEKLTVEKSSEYLKLQGITSLAGNEGLSLALGGATNGISPLEMAGGFATIANNGVYIEPTFYTKIVDASGNVYMEKQQETHRVYSEQNAWILQSLLTEPTGTGLTGSSGATATGAVIKGMQTCGKTGTTNSNVTTWFCGFTPYYTASMYFGYDSQETAENYRSARAPGSGTVARRWASIMKQIHSGLESASFERPSGITTARVCTKSGLLASDLCREAGCVYTEYFATGTEPDEYCSTHVEAVVCSETGLLAGENCPNPVRKVFIDRADRETNTAWTSARDAGSMVPTEVCNHPVTTPTEPEEPTETDEPEEEDPEESEETGSSSGGNETTPSEPSEPTTPGNVETQN